MLFINLCTTHHHVDVFMSSDLVITGQTPVNLHAGLKTVIMLLVYQLHVVIFSFLHGKVRSCPAFDLEQIQGRLGMLIEYCHLTSSKPFTKVGQYII